VIVELLVKIGQYLTKLSPVHTSDNVAKTATMSPKPRHCRQKHNVAGFGDNVAGYNVAGFAVFGDIVAGVDGAL